MKRIPAIIFLIATNCYLHAQTVTGSWFGTADAVLEGIHNNYLTELIIKQKGDEVEGVFGYYFKNMYQSFFIRGKYDSQTRLVSIKNIPVIHFQASSSNEMDCPMDFEGTLTVSKAKSTLKGYFYRPEKYRYTCPDLHVVYTLDNGDKNADSVLRNTIAMHKIWSPLPEDIVVIRTTSTGSNSNKTLITDDKEVAETKRLIDKYAARKNMIQKEIIVNSDSLRVSFYDNGDIDGDSISVFMNGTPVLSKKGLDVKAINLYIKLDSTRAVNEITMFAENLGKYPPNTALMVIFDGEKRYEVYLSSSLTQNASVRIRRRK